MVLTNQYLELKKPTINYLWLALNTNRDVIGYFYLCLITGRMVGLRIVSESCYEVQKLAVARNYRKMGVSNKLWEKMEKEGNLLCPKGISSFLS